MNMLCFAPVVYGISISPQILSFLRRGFEDYRVSGGELAFQQLCSEITLEFNDCSKQVSLSES